MCFETQKGPVADVITNQLNWLSAYTAHIQTVTLLCVCVGETGRVYVCVRCLRTYSCRFGGFVDEQSVSNEVNELSKLICVVNTRTHTRRHSRLFIQWIRQHITQRIVYISMCICDECVFVCSRTIAHAHTRTNVAE